MIRTPKILQVTAMAMLKPVRVAGVGEASASAAVLGRVREEEEEREVGEEVVVGEVVVAPVVVGEAGVVSGASFVSMLWEEWLV